MANIKEVFLIALTIVIIAGAATYIGGGEITGKAINQETKISVSPPIIGDDRNIQVTVIPGSEGAENAVYIYRTSSKIAPGKKAYTKLYYCTNGGRTCEDESTFSLKLNADDEGLYYASVRDCSGLTNPLTECKTLGKEIKSFFNVEKHKLLTEEERSITDPINIIGGAY